MAFIQYRKKEIAYILQFSELSFSFSRMHKTFLKDTVQRLFWKKGRCETRQPNYLATKPFQVFFIMFLMHIMLKLPALWPATAILGMTFWNPRSTSHQASCCYSLDLLLLFMWVRGVQYDLMPATFTALGKGKLTTNHQVIQYKHQHHSWLNQ